MIEIKLYIQRTILCYIVCPTQVSFHLFFSLLTISQGVLFLSVASRTHLKHRPFSNQDTKILYIYYIKTFYKLFITSSMLLLLRTYSLFQLSNLSFKLIKFFYVHLIEEMLCESLIKVMVAHLGFFKFKILLF